MLSVTWIESAVLRMSSAISVFCRCERMSRFIDPTASSCPSITSSLVCSMARELPLAPEPPRPPEALKAPRRLVCSLRISYSSTPSASRSGRWRA